MSLVYCFTGLPGAGKSAACSVARKKDIPVVEMGNVVRTKATDELGDDCSSDAIGVWATEHRDMHGNDIFAQYTADEVEEYIEVGNDQVVIDGLRTPNELEIFRDRFNDVTVVFVEATFQSRLERIKERARDDEEEFDVADLKNRDEREKEWGVQEIIDSSLYDMRIVNEGPYQEFTSHLATVFDNS